MRAMDERLEPDDAEAASHSSPSKELRSIASGPSAWSQLWSPACDQAADDNFASVSPQTCRCSHQGPNCELWDQNQSLNLGRAAAWTSTGGRAEYAYRTLETGTRTVPKRPTNLSGPGDDSSSPLQLHRTGCVLIGTGQRC